VGEVSYSNNEIFLYDGTATIQLTNNSYNDGSPVINDNDYVVWSGRNGSDREIFLYDGTNIIQLTDNSYDDFAPQMNAKGHVAWASEYYGIFLYDGTSTTHIGDGSYFVLNDNGQLVWHFCYGGDHGLCPTNNFGIFFYDGVAARPLTLFLYEGFGPYLNNSGQIVWSGIGVSGPGVFLYEPGGVTWTVASTLTKESNSTSQAMNYFALLLLPVGLLLLWKGVRGRT
jgi:hypothetical protein